MMLRLILRSRLILGAAVIATALSLWFPRWHYSDVSEEGAFALWGVPAPMVRSGLFYANYFSLDRRRTWIERKLYMYRHTSPSDQPQIYPVGILTNLGTYTGVIAGAVGLVKGHRRKSLSKTVRED